MAGSRINITLTSNTTSQIENGLLVGQDLVLVQSLTDPAHFNLAPIGGGSAPIYIPTPKILIGRSSVQQHVRGAELFAGNSGVTNSCPVINLTYENTGISGWTNYNPHYILFYRHSNIRRRKNGGRQWAPYHTRMFVHPAQITDGTLGPSMFSNYSSGNYSIRYSNAVQFLVADKATEWPVQTSFDVNGTLKPCATRISNGLNTLNQLHPAQYYSLGDNSGGFAPGQDLFPISPGQWKDAVRGIGMTMRHRWAPSRVLSVKFAIAINVGGKMYIGQSSDILNFRPMLGYFGGSLDPYFYKWRASFI